MRSNSSNYEARVYRVEHPTALYERKTYLNPDEISDPDELIKMREVLVETAARISQRAYDLIAQTKDREKGR